MYNSKYDIIELKKLLKSVISASFSQIRDILDENIGSDNQKENFLNTLFSIHFLVSKTLIVFRFIKNYQEISDLNKYNQYIETLDAYLIHFSIQLQTIKHDIDYRFKTPFYDIPAAIDLLVGKGKCRLPPITYSEQFKKNSILETNQEINLLHNFMKYTSISLEFPSKVSISFENGYLIMSSPKEYKLYLTLSSLDKPFFCYRLEFLMPNWFELTKSSIYDFKTTNYYITLNTIQKLTQIINNFFEKDKSPFIKTHEFLSKICIVLDLQRLKRSALQISSSFPINIRPIFNQHTLIIEYLNQFLHIVYDNKYSLTIKFNNKFMGNAYQMNMIDILYEFRKYVIIEKLKLIQQHIGGKIIEDTYLSPHLQIQDNLNIYLEKISGKYYIKENNIKLPNSIKEIIEYIYKFKKLNK